MTLFVSYMYCCLLEETFHRSGSVF